MCMRECCTPGEGRRLAPSLNTWRIWADRSHHFSLNMILWTWQRMTLGYKKIQPHGNSTWRCCAGQNIFTRPIRCQNESHLHGIKCFLSVRTRIHNPTGHCTIRIENRLHVPPYQWCHGPPYQWHHVSQTGVRRGKDAGALWSSVHFWAFAVNNKTQRHTQAKRTLCVLWHWFFNHINCSVHIRSYTCASCSHKNYSKESYLHLRKPIEFCILENPSCSLIFF